MEEIDPDEYCAMQEAKAREKNPEEEYQMEAAYLLGAIRDKIDELEKFIDDLIGKMKQQDSKWKHQNRHKDALSKPANRLKDSERERRCQKKETKRQRRSRKLAREPRK